MTTKVEKAAAVAAAVVVEKPKNVVKPEVEVSEASGHQETNDCWVWFV